MKILITFSLAVALVSAQQSNPTSLLQVKRIYIESLTGGAAAAALRDLLISGLNGTKLFILTENPDRADAILKGAAEDHSYEEWLDTNSGVSTHEGAGKTSSSKSILTLGSGLSANAGASDNESHHYRDRKHEAFAALRLVNRDGDVIWSTTQESNGAKFRSASSDVAAKVANQLQLDLEREQAAQSKSTGQPHP